MCGRMALARLHRDSQPASQPRRLGRHSPGRTRDRVRRPPRGRPAWSPRAPLPGDTSTRLSPRDPRPPDQRPPHHHHALLLMNTHSSLYTRTKHHCHNTTRRHRPISCSCLLPSCHCCHRAAASPCALLPGDNRPRTPRAAAAHPRRCPRPRRGSRPPSHTLCPTHRDFPACHPCRAPPTATLLDDPSHRLSPARNSIHCGVQQAVCVAAAGPCAAGPPAHPGPRSRRRRAQRKCPLLALGALALPE